jgi:hypothetical protein
MNQLCFIIIENLILPPGCKPFRLGAGPVENSVSGSQIISVLQVTISRSDGVLE